MSMLWLNLILGLNFIFFCFKRNIIHYHIPKQREIIFKPRIKLSHNIYTLIPTLDFPGFWGLLDLLGLPFVCSPVSGNKILFKMRFFFFQIKTEINMG